MNLIKNPNLKNPFKTNDTQFDQRETNINHLSGDECCVIESNERFWVDKVYELEKKYPDEVVITREPEDDWGFIRAYIPYKAMKKVNISHREMSDEQKEAAKERMSKARSARKSKDKE